MSDLNTSLARLDDQERELLLDALDAFTSPWPIRNPSYPTSPSAGISKKAESPPKTSPFWRTSSN